LLFTDILGQPICSIFKGQAGTDKLSQNFRKQLQTYTW